MDGDCFIDSDCDADSTSGLHLLSKKANRREKQGRKRKMNQQNGKKRKIARSETSTFSDLDLTDVFQEIRNQKQLAVRCGKMRGWLYRIKYDNGEKCILCKGQWFTPIQFEKFGGKGNNKKWKFSILYEASNGLQRVQLLKLIQNGCLSEFGQLRESFKQVTQTDRDDANSVQNVTDSSELIESLNSFPESWKRLFSKALKVSLCRNEDEALQKKTSQTDSSSDESVSVAERVKMNRRESVNSAENASKAIIEQTESAGSDKDSPTPDVSEPAVSSVIEEADLSTDELAGGGTAAAQLNFSASAAGWQNPVDSDETHETGQLQLFAFLAKQFNTINNTLNSIDSSLKKLVERQSQYITVTPAPIGSSQINSLVKQEQVAEVVKT